MYETDAGRRPVEGFLDSLPAEVRAHVMSDVELVSRWGRQAPVSVKAMKGNRNRGLMEIRTRGFRTFYCVASEVMWLLHGCKKQDQNAGIAVARERMGRIG
jgi:hypothetical protein